MTDTKYIGEHERNRESELWRWTMLLSVNCWRQRHEWHDCCMVLRRVIWCLVVVVQQVHYAMNPRDCAPETVSTPRPWQQHIPQHSVYLLFPSRLLQTSPFLLSSCFFGEHNGLTSNFSPSRNSTWAWLPWHNPLVILIWSVQICRSNRGYVSPLDCWADSYATATGGARN